jgi:hypothetical protein
MGIQGIQNDKNYPFSILQNLFIQNLCERLTLKLNQDSHPKENFKEIHFNLFPKINFKILLIADWSKKNCSKINFNPRNKTTR